MGAATNPINLLRAWLVIRDMEKQAVKEKTMNGESKPGWKTTEFWLTIATQVPVVLGIFLGATNPITLGIGAAATVAYTLSRAWSKGNAGAVAMAALQAAAEEAKKIQPPLPPK